MTANRLPGGLIEGGEIFTLNRMPMYLDANGVKDFWQAPRPVLDALLHSMRSQPKVEAAMEVRVGSDERRKLEEFAKCQYGALNTAPDIDNNGNLSTPEYVPCSERGNCPVEGVGCSSIMVQQGIFLTKIETRVFKLVIWPDRIIAAMLEMNELTIKTHWKNIRMKMGLQSKLQIVHWATERGII